MKLTKRMQGVANFVTPGLIVADIGTDHSYLPIYLVSNNIVPKAVAMDVNKGPLKIAQENIDNEGLSDKITTRLSDGLTKLNEGEAQSVIVAGMGGRLVLKILLEGKEKWKDIKEFILQPQSELELFRRQMKAWGFVCIAEDMVFEDGKYYPMGKYVRTETSVENLCIIDEDKDVQLSDEEIIFYRYGEGLLKAKNTVLMQYLDKEKSHLEQVRKSVEASAESDKKQARLEEIEQNKQANQFALQYIERQ